MKQFHNSDFNLLRLILCRVIWRYIPRYVDWHLACQETEGLLFNYAPLAYNESETQCAVLGRPLSLASERATFV